MDEKWIGQEADRRTRIEASTVALAVLFHELLSGKEVCWRTVHWFNLLELLLYKVRFAVVT